MKKMEAARAIMRVHNSLETRKLSLSTIVKKTWFDFERGSWRMRGCGYDYTV